MIKSVENVYTKTNDVVSSLYNIFGDEMVFYQVPSFNDANFKNYAISHLWSNLNMYGEINYNITNTSIFNGGLLNSSFEGLPDAFWNTGMVVGVFNNDTYREKFDGYNFGLHIPLNSSYTGMTSGLTATTLYTAFIWEPNSLEINPQSFCSGVKQDGKISESVPQFTNGIGIGFPFVDGTNPLNKTEFFDSGIAYLVSDNVFRTFTGGTGPTLSWGFGFGRTDKYAVGAKSINIDFAHTLYPNYYDTIVGLINLNSGIFYIWDKNLVQGFDFTAFVGNTLTGATTTSGNTYAVVQDIDEEVVLAIDIIAKPGEWQDTTNPSIIGENCNTVFTSICLYDDKGNLLGVAKPNEAVNIPADGYTPINLELPISGSINEDDGSWTEGVILSL